MIRAVVFDFDGVIANSEPLHFRAMRDVLSTRGVTLTERSYYDRYLGYDDAGAFRAVAEDAGVIVSEADIAHLISAKTARMEALGHEGSVLFPGAKAAVERIAEAGPIAIASGALRAEILRVLDHERLTPLFRAIVGAEDTPASKPAPDPYVRAVSLLAQQTDGSIVPSECVAVEDSRWGLQSARAAGLRTVGITHTYSPDELVDADVVIDHLDRLTWPFLRRLDASPPTGPSPIR